MIKKRYLVTGGTGFIGSALVKKLVHAGHAVKILDDDSRGNPRRLGKVMNDVEMFRGDVRKADDVVQASADCDGIIHLSFVNGTEFFYSKPDLVLDVGLKGMINVIDACRHHNIREIVLASSSEVCQTAPKIPTAEDAPLVVPDVMNPRYSHGAGKLISEVMAINYGRKSFLKLHILANFPRRCFWSPRFLS
jgi:nucleoside-diphosphate-sugar epimerase